MIKATFVSVLGSCAPHALMQATGQFHEHVLAVSTRIKMYEPERAVLLQPFVQLPRLPLDVAQGLDCCSHWPTHTACAGMFELVESSLGLYAPHASDSLARYWSLGP